MKPSTHITCTGISGDLGALSFIFLLLSGKQKRGKYIVMGSSFQVSRRHPSLVEMRIQDDWWVWGGQQTTRDDH